MSKENVEKVRSSLDGWNRGDRGAWLQAAHPRVEFVSAVARQMEGDQTVFRGPAELRRFWDDWHEVWNLRIEVSEIRDLGDAVLALGRMRTRGKASGAELESPVAYVFEFEDGLARRVRAYTDPSEALQDVGLREEAQ